jgi:hypothetical protein
MTTKGVTICLGLVLLACWVLLVPNISFAGDKDKDLSGGPVMAANSDKDKDGGGPGPILPPGLFKSPLQFPQYIGSYDVRGSDQAQGKRHYGWGNGNHYGWGNGGHYHYASPSK